MNKITIALTEDQLRKITDLVSREIHEKAFTGQSEYVAFLSRMNSKLYARLAKAKNS